VNATCRPRRALCAALLLLAAAPLRAENWPQWRGPTNDGVSTEKGLPAEWNDAKNIAWKLKMPGAGASTPVVWGDRLFLTCQDGKNLVLMCVSTTGKELWRRPMGPATRWARGDEGNGASPSPSTDGKHVFAFVGNGTFAAFDFEGKQVWKFDAQKRYGRFDIQFGIHSTPVLYGDRLYFQLIHSGTPDRAEGKVGWVVAVDKNTGADVWKVERKSEGTDENEHSYASAFLWKRGKSAYLVVHGNDYATAHRLEDGKEVWRLGDLNPRDRYNRTLRFVASPLCTPDLIVVPSAKNGPLVALKPDAQGKVMAGNKFEQWRMAHNTPDVSSPLLVDGLVYLCSPGRENGSLLVVDAKTGEKVYNKRVHPGRHRGSPVYADGKVYLTARDGTVSVVQAGRTFNLLAKNKLPDQIAASPAVSGGRIYLHGFSYLWAVSSR
jgi:outer membrane protein assembly factor BamB